MPTYLLTTPVPIGTPGQATWSDAALVLNGTAWLLLGNSGTNDAINFLGTTDAQDLAFRTNNAERMRFLATGEFAIGTAPAAGIGGIIDLTAFAGSGVLLDSNVGASTSLGFREAGGGPGVSSFVASNQTGTSYAYSLPPSVPDPGPADPGDMGLGFMQVDGVVAGNPTMAWVQTRQYQIDSTTPGAANWNAGLPSILAGATAAFIFDLPGTLEFDTIELGLQEKYIVGAGGQLMWHAAIRPGGGAMTLQIYNYGANPSSADAQPQITVRVTRN